MSNNKEPIRVKKKIVVTQGMVRQAKGKSPPRHRMSRRTFIMAGILMLIGIVLIGYQPVINHIIGPRQLKKVYANSTSAETIQENAERFASLDVPEELFDYESVRLMTTLDINPTIQSENVIGGLYVPSVDLVIPIMYGVTQDILSSSAGTMKPEQEMGVGNYSLIGHNSKNPNVLFAPIHRISLGDKMYITDKQRVYEYEMTAHTIVQPEDIEVIDDVEGLSLLTLISCTPNGKERAIVQGELVAVHKYEVAPVDVIEALNDL